MTTFRIDYPNPLRPTEFFATHAAATTRLGELVRNGCGEVVLWEDAESAGPWGWDGDRAAEDSICGPNGSGVSTDALATVERSCGFEFEDWQMQMFETVRRTA